MSARRLSKSKENQSKVQYSLGVTLNAGNFESVRIMVGLERTCNQEDEDKTFREIYEKVENLTKQKIAKVRDSGYE